MLNDNEILIFEITEDEADIRLDKVISNRFPQYSRSYLQKRFEDKYISCNEKALSKKDKLSAKSEVKIYIPQPKEISAKPQNIPIDIVYEDDDLLVLALLFNLAGNLGTFDIRCADLCCFAA